jgi:hypothetical protein
MSAEPRTPSSSSTHPAAKADTKHTTLLATEEAIAALLASADCLHPEPPVTNESELNYLTQLTTALATNEFDETAYTQLFTRLKADILSPAAIYRFANLCYRYWHSQWPTANALQTQQTEIDRHTARLQIMAQGRTLFRRADTPTRYYWGSSNATSSTTTEKGQFYSCYPDFDPGQGDGVKAIYQPEAITSAADISICEAYVNTKRAQQLTSRMQEHSAVLLEKLQQHGRHTKIIVNLQLASLYYRSRHLINTLSIHTSGQAVFYFRQAIGEIARHGFTQQKPPLPPKLIAAAEQLHLLIDQAVIEHAQATLFTAQSATLLARWEQCYEEPEPTLETIYQLTQETTTLLAHAANVPRAAKQSLIQAWLAGFNLSLKKDEDDLKVRLAMQSAVLLACNPISKHPHSLATVHQWLLEMAQQLQQHGETNRAQALLHAYQQVLIGKQPNLQQNASSAGPRKTAYSAVLATCEQILKDLDQRLTSSSISAEAKTIAPPNAPASAFGTRTQDLEDWCKRLNTALPLGVAAHTIYADNIEFARKLLAGICHEIEQQIGPPPCAYTLLGAGSFSRGEISPASDLDCALLVADASVKTVVEDENGNIKITFHPWFQRFLPILQLKLASLPAGILALENETISWITKGYWFDTAEGFIKQHLTSQQPSNPKSVQQPENFSAQWFRWMYSSGNKPQQEDTLFRDYQKDLQAFFHTKIGTSTLPAYQQLAPWSLVQHIGQAVAPKPRTLSLIPSSTPTDSATKEAKETKESKHEVGESSTKTTFTVLNVKNLAYRLINAILCYGRFNDVPLGITTTREVLTYLKNRQVLPASFITRLGTALAQLYTWRLRQHWTWLHNEGELDENEVVLWPEDTSQQTALQTLSTERRGFYLNETETQQCLTIITTVAEVIGRGVEGFANFAAGMTALAALSVAQSTPLASSPLSSSSTTTTSAVKEETELKEAKREVSEEEAKALRQPSATPIFNPLAAAIEWTLHQLSSKPKDNKTSIEAHNKAQSEHVIWLSQIMGSCANELPLEDARSSDPVRVKQDPLFRKHWQLYWKLPPHWRSLYIDHLRQHVDSATTESIIKPLCRAPNSVGWRLTTQEKQNQWQRSLRSLLTQDPVSTLPDVAKDDIATGKAVWVQWIENHQVLWAPLKPEHANVLLVSDAKSTRWQPKPNASGNHHVYRLKTGEGFFWVKRYPEQPGMGRLVGDLDNRFGVDCVPQQQEMVLHHAPVNVKDGTAAGMKITQSAIVVSEHAADQSQSLQTILEKQPQLLAKLDFISFIKMLLRVLLTNPEDDKANDYFVVRIPGTDLYVLIRIDNERAFLPVSYFSKGWILRQEELQVKSIVYCLDQMMTTWDSDPRVAELLEDLRQLQPAALIADLLKEMNTLHNDWQQLFPRDIVHQHACLQEPWMSLPTPMLPQGIENTLLKRLTSLQTALRLLKPSEITGLKLLEIVQPELAKFYNLSLFQGELAPDATPTNRHADARFEQVAGPYYKRPSNQAGGRTTRTTGPTMLSRQSSVILPELPKTDEEREKLKIFAQDIWEKKANSAAQALAAVEQWRGGEVTRVKENLLANGASPADTARIRKEARIQFGLLPGREQQRVIEQVFASKPGTALTLQEQEYLLKVLVGAQCHNLDFRPFKTILTNELLLPILRNADKQIIKLDLSGCTQLNSKALDSDIFKDIERYCPYLKRLRINDQTNRKNIYIGNFAELTILECNQATALTDFRFGRLPKLKKLSLANAAKLEILGNQGLGITASTQAWPLPQLQQLDTRNCSLLKFVHIKVDKPQALNWQSQGCVTLKVPSIYFSWVQGSAELLDRLAATLKDDPALIPFGLLFEKINDPKILERSLKTEPPFALLDIQEIQRNDDRDGTKFQSIVTMLEAKLPLASLNADSIGVAGAQALVKALKTKPPLAMLNLGSNNIGGAGAQALANVLKSKLPLAMLNLGSNNIGDAGAQALANVLKTKPPLASLNFTWNYIGDAGAQALAEALKANPPLASLDLSWNNIGDAGAQALAEALKANPSLTTLNLYHGHVGDAGAQALADALAHNRALTDLKIGENDEISTTTRKTINDYLTRNRALVTQLITAITAFQHNQAAALLEQGVSVNQVITYKIDKVNQGYTPLMVAVRTGDRAMVAMVLAQTFNLFLLSETPKDNLAFPNQTALQIAIQLHKQTPAKAAAFTDIIRQLIDAYAKHGFAVPIYGTQWLAEFCHSPAEAKSITTSALSLSSTSSSSTTTAWARHTVPLPSTTEESDSEEEELVNDKFTAPATSSPPPEHKQPFLRPLSASPFSLVDSKALNQPATTQTTLSASSSSSSALFQPAPRSQPTETKDSKQTIAEHKAVPENQQMQQRLADKPPSEESDALENNETTLLEEQAESTTALEH